LQGDRLHGDPGVLEPLRRHDPARHLRLAQRHLDRLLRQVGHRAHVPGVAGGSGDLHDVLGEVLRVRRVPGADDLVHVRRCRRGEHVGRRAAGDLLGQAGARPEAELHRVARVGGLELLAELGEALRQRCRGEDGYRPARRAGGRTRRASRTAAGAARGGDGRQRGGNDKETAHYELLGWVSPERDHRMAGISTETLVALIAATASTPGSRPSSSAASRLSSDTNLCGPAWISTWAITVSRRTRLTRPLNLFRTEWATTARPSVRSPISASSHANRASSAPSTASRPEASVVVSIRPPSAQRRRVSSLTPIRSAASLIRNVGTTRL